MAETPFSPENMHFVVKQTQAPVRNGELVLGATPDELTGADFLPAWVAHGEITDPEGRLVLSAGAALIPGHKPRPFVAGLATDESTRDMLAAGNTPSGTRGDSILQVTYPRYLAYTPDDLSGRYSTLDVPLASSARSPIKIASVAITKLRQEMESRWGSNGGRASH